MRSKSVAIRPLKYGHIVPLVRICNQTFLEWARFPEHGVQAVRLIKEQPAWQWGAFEGDTLLGFLLCSHRPERRTVAIKLIGTDPTARGRGIGSLLLARLEKKAVLTGQETLSVGTPFATGFYEKNGFKLAQTTLRMIRDIAQTSIRLPASLSVRPLSMDDAPAIVDRLPDGARKHRFLEAFLAAYRQNGRFAVRIEKNRRLAGVCVGAADGVYADFARIALALPIQGAMEDVVRGIEYAVSMQGLRHVGFQMPEAQEALFAKLGYERAARDYFWTMYTLRKGVRKAENVER